MATVTFDHVWKKYGEVVAVNDLNLEDPGRRVHGPRGTVGLRQDHVAAHDRGPGGDLRGHAAHRRQGRQQRAAQGPRHRDGVPVLRALPAHDRARQPRVRPQAAQDTQGPRSSSASTRRRRCSPARTCSTASRASSPAASGSASRSVAPSCASRPCSSWTSRSPTWTPSCACRRVPRSPACTSGSRTTTVYVTHDQVEAMTMGQRIAVMSEARLQQVGTPQSLYDHPANRFVAGFIGSPSMNFLDVEVQRRRRRSRSGDGHRHAAAGVASRAA